MPPNEQLSGGSASALHPPQLIHDVGPFRITVPTRHRCENDVAGGHEDRRDRVELPLRTRILFRVSYSPKGACSS